MLPCLVLVVVASATSFGPGSPGLFAQVCDPNGSPPRFGCTWDLTLCDWVCPICDPFGPPPRSTCTWDGNTCNWVCPGYTGTDVTVDTKKAPTHDATVYLRLSSICTATGAGGSCGGSFPVSHQMSLADKCLAIADALTAACAETGYAVTVNACALQGEFTASNVGCPATAFALGLSNDPSVFDQTASGPLPDGESETITGSSKSCPHIPAAVTNLQIGTSGGASLLLTWDDEADADDYLVFSDPSPNGSFSNVAGIATSGTTGLTLGMQSGDSYYLVAGRNSSCGLGPKR